ncbi:AAA family ATPase [Rhizobium sp. Rhizsp82]|uniref:AAA family ATPase n=1 Tax=Rhizobium sp. Rhizsp82 TaxID=3243057 RepID=UPI0039B5931B
MPIGTKNEKINSFVKHYALYRTFERALDQTPVFKEGGSGVIALVVPPGRKAEEYKACAVAYLFGEVDRDGWDKVGYAIVSASDKADRVKAEFSEKCAGRDRAIVLTEVKTLPSIVSVTLDAVIKIDPVTEDDLREACLHVLRIRVTAKQANRLLSFPWELMLAALRRAGSAPDAIRRLEAVLPEAPEKRPIVERGFRLDELHGYGPAKEWGVQLASDLEAWRTGKLKWSDVDRGLLLSGPPGVGKTIFARALADYCGVNFLATSVVQWQAKGHLGDLLKAMRADFSLAIDMAPTILLLDELDSIGNRETFSGEYASYSIQVVNALLEALDGSAHRDGLVVIGATNYVDKIDAAVRRPGRLDRHVAIGMPNEADRVAIVTQMLADNTPSDLHLIGPATEGMVGADLARMVRDAKKLARREDRALGLSDLMSELPPLIPVEGVFRRNVAIHEAGHALVGVAVKIGEFDSLSISRQVNPRFAVQSGGQARFFMPALRVRNSQRLLDDICFRLGGIAAERVIVGSHGDGAGIGPTSDLAVATDLALQLETRFGMGSRLHHFGSEAWQAFGASSASWPISRVEKILRQELARAEKIVTVNRAVLLAVASELERVGFVAAERFKELCIEMELDTPAAKMSSRHSRDVQFNGRDINNATPESPSEVRQ